VTAPYYREVGDEVRAFTAAHATRRAGPAQGADRLRQVAVRRGDGGALDRPLVTVACNDETSAHDLLGRWLVKGGDTVWQDGPVTRAVKQGAILYLDEVAEAREDVIVVLHPLADHRRQLHVDRLDLTLTAGPGFMLVASYNPGYRRGLKELKPSTRQRFIAIGFGYPAPELEVEIVATEAALEPAAARKLVALAGKIRKLDELGLAETVSTRLLVNAGKLIGAGVPPRRACAVAVVTPLSDDAETLRALQDLVDLTL
jgi:nitric oxide reductase NorQ protein